MEEFTPEAVSKVSKACTSICMWVRAMYVYHNVALQVRGAGKCGDRMGSDRRGGGWLSKSAWLCACATTWRCRQAKQEKASGVKQRRHPIAHSTLVNLCIHSLCRLLPSVLL